MTTERRLVDKEVFHKWIGSLVAVSCVIWSITAYFIKAEDNQLKLYLENDIYRLKTQQAASMKINDLVLSIDKRLASIEGALQYQNRLADELKALHKEVEDIKLQIAKGE